MAVVITVLACLFSIGIHYEALRLASSQLILSSVPPRLRVAAAVIVALIAHLLEVVAFSIALALMLQGGHGELTNGTADPESLLYFSLSCYTSLGIGDIAPLGSLRVFCGIEALVGLVMIGWTASFTYLEMRMYWLDEKALAHQAKLEGSTATRLDG